MNKDLTLNFKDSMGSINSFHDVSNHLAEPLAPSLSFNKALPLLLLNVHIPLVAIVLIL
jgi:hypothetical protein